MTFAATITRSHMQAELRDLERALADGTKCARRRFPSLPSRGAFGVGIQSHFPRLRLVTARSSKARMI